MYVDNNLLLSGSVSAAGVLSGQALTSAAGTVLATNAIDLLQNRDIGEGKPLFMRVETLVAVSGGTSMQFQLIASDAANGTGNVTVVADTGAHAVASLVAGSRFVAAVNMRLANKGQRYLTAQAVSVGTTTTGTHVIDIGLEVQDGQKFYPSGFAVL